MSDCYGFGTLAFCARNSEKFRKKGCKVKYCVIK